MVPCTPGGTEVEAARAPARAIERHVRDLLTLSKHVLTHSRLLDLVGGLWLGTEDDHPRLSPHLM
jgi:hypothetical protein